MASEMSVGGVVTGIGPAVDGRRRELGRLLAGPGAQWIVVGHRGRLARFGAGHLRAALAARGRQVMILGPGELGDGLVRDVIEVLTSLCARLYGRRGARNRAGRAVGCARSPGA